jgi:hypothetical protein
VKVRDLFSFPLSLLLIRTSLGSTVALTMSFCAGLTMLKYRLVVFASHGIDFGVLEKSRLFTPSNGFHDGVGLG